MIKVLSEIQSCIKIMTVQHLLPLFFSVKTNLPHFTGRSSKSLDMQFLLHTHIQGVMNHGLQRFAKYVDINEYCHDSNMVINTLLKEIYETNVHMY